MKTDTACPRAALGVVITGGSSGIGYALAREFLAAGDRVVICSRQKVRLEKALASLGRSCPGAHVSGMVCDVSDPSMVAEFARFASDSLGRVDRWINNAGTAGALKRPLSGLTPEDISETCSTNLAGSMLLCAEALRIMERQPVTREPAYHIFNMGFSLTGARFSRSNIPHKVSKRAVTLLTGFLSNELKRTGITSVGVHEISPGLVLTPLLTRDVPQQTLRFLRKVAREPEEVAAVLVPKIRSISGCNRKVSFMPFLPFMISMLSAVMAGQER
ncbi:MAG: SDR family oxidoreductase [Chlorobiaceae bacterium]|nr:SDR family oxidoreductase [Chlorobiaceae bacterium]NTV60871.1 SDR family oxidoreductase [Chlorobiaceae bacterium]